jgi:hypothetical protein
MYCDSILIVKKIENFQPYLVLKLPNQFFFISSNGVIDQNFEKPTSTLR